MTRKVFSPLAFAVLAAALLVGYGACHLAGFEAYVSLLSGTLPDGRAPDEGAVARCVAYVLLRFAAVVLAPILALASGAWALLERLYQRRARSPRAAPP